MRSACPPGLDKWTAEKQPVTEDFPEIREGDFKAQERDCYVATDQLKARVKQANVIVLDARSPKAPSVPLLSWTRYTTRFGAAK